MLVSIYIPFSDFRFLFADGFSRLERPRWPFPEAGRWHVRGIGSIRNRPKQGFEGWVGEDRLAIGVSAIALQLPERADLAGLTSIRLIRKACFFDGLLNGRVEMLFAIAATVQNRERALSAAKFLLDVPTRVDRHGFNGTLRTVARSVGKLWAESTVKHGYKTYVDLVRVGRPICIVENYSNLADEHSKRVDSPLDHPHIELTVLSGQTQSEIMLIYPSNCNSLDIHDYRGSAFRMQSRFLRTYTLRLLQNLEGLSLLCGMQAPNISDDRIQNLLNEYTRQINRSRQRLEAYAASNTIEYCYSSFSRVYPGRIEALRVTLQNSNIRPNIVRKVLELLDISQLSNISVAGDFNMEKIMGDKFEHIDVSGQGTAIGRGASASVTQSNNAPTNVETLSKALSSLAEHIRNQTGKEDNEVEATLIDAAAKKAESGDEAGAAAILRKSAGWVLDVAKSAGSAVLVTFLKSQLGIG